MKYAFVLVCSATLLAACGAQHPPASSGPSLIQVGGNGTADTNVVTAQAGKSGTVGTQVRDGDLTFLVTKVDTTNTVGDKSNPALQVTAAGVYIVVHLEVLNTSKVTQSFLGDAQQLRDAVGHTYSPDSMAGLLARNAEQLAPGAEIAPGAQTKLTLVYDVPPGTVPKELDLHTDFGSDGAKVALA